MASANPRQVIASHSGGSGSKFRVFISYPYGDRAVAAHLTEHLTSLGYEVFQADEGLTPGQDWRAAISEALRNADAMLILVTPNAVRSSWVAAEAGAALAYAEERGRPLVIPIVLDDAEVPSALNHIHWMKGSASSPAELEEVALRIGSALENAIGRKMARDEKRQEVRERVERKAAEFIKEALDALRRRESSYRRIAYGWYVVGFGALLVGVYAATLRARIAVDAHLEWPSLVEFSVFGFLIVALLIALAKYAFTLGKSFMAESLRNADRIHAISFGEFYLNAYGDEAEWKEVKEALQHWNIDKGSSFASQDSKQFDPQLVEALVQLVKAAAAKAEK
jgi:hypothetical protein